MILAIVKGNVVSTNKTEKLLGGKLLIVEEWNIDTGKTSGRPQVALDIVGAGTGELVMCVSGSSARQTVETDKRPIDLAIIGIVDEVELEGKARFKKYSDTAHTETSKPLAEQKPAQKPVPKNQEAPQDSKS